MAQRAERESIWSIDRRLKIAYYVLFSFGTLFGVFFLIIETTFDIRNMDTWLTLLAKAAPIGTGVAIVSLALIELGGGTFMVIAPWIIEKLNQRRAEQEQETRQQLVRDLAPVIAEAARAAAKEAVAAEGKSHQKKGRAKRRSKSKQQ